MLKLYACCALLCLLMAPTSLPLAAADEGEDPLRRDPNSALVQKALAKLLEKEAVVWRGQVARDVPEGSGSPFGSIVIGGGRVSKTRPFRGKFEARVAGATTLIVSEAALPGFGIYADGKRTITRATYTKDAPNLAELQREMPALLDRTHLATWLAKSTWGKVDSDPREQVFKAEINKKLLPKAPSPTGMRIVPTATVLRCQAAITLDPSGSTARLVFTVQRSDPMAAMRKRFGGGRGIPGFGPPGGGQDGEDRGDEGADEDAEEAIGAVTTYTLDFHAGEPRTRLQRFAAAMREEFGGKKGATR